MFACLKLSIINVWDPYNSHFCLYQNGLLINRSGVELHNTTFKHLQTAEQKPAILAKFYLLQKH